MATVAIQAASSGDNTLVAAVANKKIVVHAVGVMAAGTVNAKFKSGASTDKSGLYYLVANAGFVLPDSPNRKAWVETAVGEALVLNLSAAVAVGGILVYELG